MQRAPLTWTFKERITPACGISTVASTNDKRSARIPSRSFLKKWKKFFSIDKQDFYTRVKVMFFPEIGIHINFDYSLSVQQQQWYIPELAYQLNILLILFLVPKSPFLKLI
jgi:hypothetical protein